MTMLNENIKNLRKQKGYTQETLAQELNVVRQTVSKWEKGYSVPDAVMLERLAELFEVSVSDLLGTANYEGEQKNDLSQISAQLSVLNNQIARELGRKKKIRKGFLIGFISLIVIAAVIMFTVGLKSRSVPEYPVENKTPLHVTVSDELDKAISEAILKTNSAKSWIGECLTEGHFIYGTEKDGENTKVYLLEAISDFEFRNGFFVDASGHSVPAVYTFRKNDSSIELINIQYAEDGSRYKDSIKKLFPPITASAILYSDGSEGTEIWEQCVEQAEKYLEKIGRKADICSYGDIEHCLLEDVGVPVEVSNDMLDKYRDYDFEIGNHEKIENGVRYVYQTEFDELENQIIYMKFEYDTGMIVEYTAVDASDGKVVHGVNRPEHANYIKGRKIKAVASTAVYTD